MRHAVRWIALLSLVIGIGVLAGILMHSPNRPGIAEAAATDFSVAMIDLAITVGIVDLLLKSYSERQRAKSIKPRASELVQKVEVLRKAQKRYLHNRSASDLERYRRIVTELERGSFDLHILMTESDPILAGELLHLSHDMAAHSETIEDAIIALRNEAGDAQRWLGDVDRQAGEIISSGTDISASLQGSFIGKKLLPEP